jgi:hypothetical protein
MRVAHALVYARWLFNVYDCDFAPDRLPSRPS